MKKAKKALGILLTLILVLALLPASALAADQVVVSPQNLCVDGAMADCMKYNINGYNYLMLRDVAMLVNGTGSQFSVSYDTEKRTVTVVTGEAYEPNGSELDLTLGDQSASAVPSNQPIIIDGVERTDLEAYNIGGHNFIKFRDLGRVLGFHTEYEQETNTAIIVSKVYTEPQKWLIQESTFTSNSGYYSHSIMEFDTEGRLVSSLYEGEGYASAYKYAYDALGRRTEARYTMRSEYSGETSESQGVTTYTYNLRGLLTEERTEETGDVVYGTTYTYDARGNVLTQRYQSNGYESLLTNTYDGNGDLIRSVSESDYGVYITNYTRDGDGNVLREWSENPDGSEGYSEEYTYENGRRVKSVYTSGDGEYSSATTYEYNEAGLCSREYTESSYGAEEMLYEYDAQGREVKYVYKTEDSVSTSTYTYDEAGRLLRTEDRNEGEYDDGEGGPYVSEYTYTAEGDPLTERSNRYDCVSETTYTYDTAARKQTCVSVDTYPTAEDLFLEDETLTLALEDEYWLYYHFAPYNAANEEVTWTSSAPDVVSVDGEGKLTALAAGKAVITAASTKSDLSASCTVTVQSEKYIISAEPMNIGVRKGQTVTVTITVDCVGQWKSYTTTWHNNDEDKFSLEWDDGGWNGNTTLLYVTGLETGEGSFLIYPSLEDGEQTGSAITLTVVVVN